MAQGSWLWGVNAVRKSPTARARCNQYTVRCNQYTVYAGRGGAVPVGWLTARSYRVPWSAHGLHYVDMMSAVTILL